MSVFYKFLDEFKYMLDAPDRETGDKQIDYELDMSDDFKTQLNNIKNSATREEGDSILKDIIAGKHEKFAEELTEILNATERADGDKKIDELLSGMDEYIGKLNSIKNAASRDEGDAILKELLS